MRPKRSAAALVQRRHCATTPGRLLVSLLGQKNRRTSSLPAWHQQPCRPHASEGRGEAALRLTQHEATLRPQESCRQAGERGRPVASQRGSRSRGFCRVDLRLSMAPKKIWKLVVKR